MWNYIQPVEILFGEGRIKEIKDLAQKMGVNRGILVCSNYFIRTKMAEQIVAESEGKLVAVFGEIAPNPDVTEVDKCADVIRANNIDFVVMIGGGSVMDCAKAAATIALTNDSIRKYHGTGLQLPTTHLPMIAVPTTAGTGSEVTSVSVLTDRELKKKAPIASTGFFPHYALIDPELTYTVPKDITASAGMDVLSHAIEAYWCKNAQPICDAMAIYSLELVFEYLERAYNNPHDTQARAKMCEASVIAGLAFALPKTTGSHACSYPLTNIYNIPHGEACGLTLDYFVRVNKDALDGKIQKLANKLGFADVDALANAIFALKKAIGLRTNLKDFNLTDAQIDELVTISKHPNLNNNPITISDEMLYEMYTSMR